MTTMTEYLITKDIAGYNGFGLPPSNTSYSATLTTGTDTTLVIPNFGVLGSSFSTLNPKVLALISLDSASAIWVNLNAPASVPVGATFSPTSSQLITGFFPAGIECKVGDTLHFFSSATTGLDVSVRLYWIQS